MENSIFSRTLKGKVTFTLVKVNILLLPSALYSFPSMNSICMRCYQFDGKRCLTLRTLLFFIYHKQFCCIYFLILFFWLLVSSPIYNV